MTYFLHFFLTIPGILGRIFLNTTKDSIKSFQAIIVTLRISTRASATSVLQSPSHRGTGPTYVRFQGQSLKVVCLWLSDYLTISEYLYLISFFSLVPGEGGRCSTGWWCSGSCWGCCSADSQSWGCCHSGCCYCCSGCLRCWQQCCKNTYLK